MIKKISFIIAFLFISLSAFSQNKGFDKDIHKLMKLKNGSIIYDGITDDLSKNIDPAKVSEFQSIMDEEIQTSIKQGTALLRENFTHRDIINIYSEMSSDEIHYSDKTLKYIRMWNQHKAAFSNKAKKIYSKYSIN